MIIIGIVLACAGGVLLYARKRTLDVVREMAFVKTSTAAEIIALQSQIAGEIGPGGLRRQVELKGVTIPGKELTAPLSGKACVYYSMTVTERYEERVTETDSQGVTRTRTQTGTSTVSSQSDMARFRLDDGTGTIAVEPAGAKIDAAPSVDRYEPSTGSGTLEFGGFRLELPGLTGGGRRVLGYQFTERIIDTGRRLYILGDAIDEGGDLRVSKPADAGMPYLISVRSEEELTRSKTRTAAWLLAGAVVAIVSGMVLVVLAVTG